MSKHTQDCPTCTEAVCTPPATRQLRKLDPVHEFNAVDDHFFLVQDDQDHMIAKVWTREHGHLFRASKDLMASLLTVLDAARAAGIHKSVDGWDQPWYPKALAAINKAKGL